MTVMPNPLTVVSVGESDQDEGKLNSVSKWCATNWRAILAELISTAVLVMFGCMACIPLDGFTTQPPLYGPLGFGLTVMTNIQIFGHISGAFMNPAVTLGRLIWGKISLPLTIAFIIVQCVGAIGGYAILVAVSPIMQSSDSICVTMAHPGINAVQALGIEIALTTALLFINCALWDPVHEHKQDSAPIKFGLAIVGLSIVGGPMTGASMNPARSLGPAVITGNWSIHWVYWAGPFIGGILGTVIYKYIFLKK